MQSLGSNNNNLPAVPGDTLGTSPVGVLPRVLRRPMRALKLVTLNSLATSRAFQMIVAAALVLPAAGYFASNNNSPGKMLATIMPATNFQVRQVVINGMMGIDEEALKFQLGFELKKSLLEFDVDVARTLVMQNSWIAEARVRKIYPDKIVIDIVEHQPFALWKTGGSVALISKDGTVITSAVTDYPVLPQVVGEGANKSAAEFLASMNRFPMIASRVDAYVRVAGRRWNLLMDDGVRVLLPEKEWQTALAELYDLQARKEILDREIVLIDMRLADRLVVRLNPQTSEIRKADILKTIKASEQKI